MHNITKSKLRQIVLQEYDNFFNPAGRIQRQLSRHSPDNYHNEFAQHLMDQEDMDEDEAVWATNEIESGSKAPLKT